MVDCNAKVRVQELDEQHKVDIVDSGWMEYLTKELGMKDTDNVLWNLTQYSITDFSCLLLIAFKAE